MNPETLNANIAQCLVTKTHWGYDSIHNVCTGATRTVEWALGDYGMVALFGALGVAMLLVGAMLAAIVIDVLRGF